jgi:hypothetical protein
MEEFLESVLIDTHKKEFKLFSNIGGEKKISCDTTDEFMNVLIHVRDNVDEDCIFYKDPVVA